ncbi:MAG: hypothetical protein LBF66_02630 [Holosporales bacterium]|jgi:tetratricopeptide (TPR) repeat protein|nr:hypothetical protein [Holosporales bacterium]
MWQKKFTVVVSLGALSVAQVLAAGSAGRTNSAEALEQALTVYEQFLQPGSAAALNQIAAAYFTLGEQAELAGEHQKAQDYFVKAAAYFVKAAETGCREAEYNVGLTYNKLKSYEKSATYYRKCINNCAELEPDLAFKAAINLSILVLEKKVPQDADEIVRWVNLCKNHQTNPKATELLQTSVTILTDINSLPKVDRAYETGGAGAVGAVATQSSST